MNRFEYTDPSGDTFAAAPTTLRDGTPILAVRVTEYDDRGPANSAVVHLPTAVLEEVIAGLRDMARQTGAPARPTVVMHEKPAEAPIIVVRPRIEGWIRA